MSGIPTIFQLLNIRNFDVNQTVSSYNQDRACKVGVLFVGV